MPGIFLLGLQEDIAVCDLLVTFEAIEIQVIDAVDALDVGRKPLEAIGQLARDR